MDTQYYQSPLDRLAAAAPNPAVSQPPLIHDSEAEKASTSYLISSVVLMVGLPFPIINMIATFIYYLANRKQTYFIRFHCLQSVLSQICIILINTVGVIWTCKIVFAGLSVTDSYFAYIITIVLFNILEFIISLQAAVRTRKKKDYRFWFFGALTEMICKPSVQ